MASSPFLFSKHSNICFAISFCTLTFPLGGFIRNMNILLGDILLIFLFYILFPNNLVTNIVFPGKQGIYLENHGIRPPFYKLGKFFLRVSWTVSI